MGRLRVNRAVCAHLSVLTGAALAAVGAGVEFGTGFGLLLGGGALSTWSVLLFDVDEPDQRKGRR